MACNDSKSTSTTTKGGLGGLGDLLGGAGTPAAPAASSLPQAVQDMLRATELGPTGYNDAMRVNVGIDTPPISAAGTSGMMGSAPSFTGYQPTPFKPDPLAPPLQRDTTTPVSASPAAVAAKPDPNAGWSPAGNVGGNDVFRLGGVYKMTKGGRTYVSDNGTGNWTPQ